jgi:hypothetical protein
MKAAGRARARGGGGGVGWVFGIAAIRTAIIKP